jgi:hypothetical protein
VPAFLWPGTGSVGDDRLQTLTYQLITIIIAQRVAEIVAKNPWLLSVLDRPTDRVLASGDMAVYYPPPGADADAAARRCFSVRDDIALSRGSTLRTYAAMVATLAPALCKTSNRSVGNGTPLWRVCVVPDAQDPGGRFALVVSANHSLMDGHGFYAVANMLCARAEVRALSPVRKQHLPALMVEAMGGEPTFLTAILPGFLLRLIGGVIWGALFPSTPCALAFHVSDTWVEAQKAAAKKAAAELEDSSGQQRQGSSGRTAAAGQQWRTAAADSKSGQQRQDSSGSVAAFTSTNDVLVSSFCGILRPTLAIMAINLRGRVKGCEEGDVGNYENAIAYMPEDYASPTLIRTSVTGGNGRTYTRAADPPTRMPTTWEQVHGATYAVISNWSTFAPGALVVPGAQQELHMPVFDPATTPAGVTVMVIFRPSGGKGVGVLVIGPRRLIEGVKASGMVGRPLGIGIDM